MRLSLGSIYVKINIFMKYDTGVLRSTFKRHGQKHPHHL